MLGVFDLFFFFGDVFLELFELFLIFVFIKLKVVY